MALLHRNLQVLADARFRRLRVEYDSDDTFRVDSQRCLSFTGVRVRET
jgi:hypothetical protein